jgi:4-hydroxy-tetrahydrodipicolinate synthase
METRMLTGSLVALVTPMREDGAVDFPALARLVDWHVAQGTDGIVSVGTTGESATLDMSEHIEVMQRTIEYARGRVPVIAGTGANSTREAIELTAAAKGLGAQACLLVTPYYNKPTQEGLYQHFKAVAEAVAIPQIVYNVPGRTGCDLKNETVERLAGVPNIAGVKDATGDLDRARDLVRRVGSRLALYSGDDATGMAFMLQGGQGVISVTNNVAPAAMSALCKAALAGQRAEAERLNGALAGLHQELFCESNPIPVKWALAEMGHIGPGIRLPLTPLSAACHARVREAMRQAAVI